MKKYIIYKHTSPNGKIYIGQTCQTANNRWKSGKGYKNNAYFYNAILKYGWDNFTHEIISSDLLLFEANWLEKYLIQYYNSTNPEFGFNITKGGDGCLGVKQTDEVKKRISEANKGKKFSKEHREKISKSLIGKTASEEVINKMRESRIKYLSEHPEAKEKCSHKGELNPMYGVHRYGKNAPCYGKHIPCSEKKKEQQSKSVIQYDLNNNVIGKYKSITEAARENDIKLEGISMCCRGKIKTYKNYNWRFAV